MTITKAFYAAVQEKMFDLTRGLITTHDLEEIHRTQGAIMALQSISDLEFAEEAAADAN